ncbi:PREDICTED: uncharacterized protein LOC109485555 [Branchiostoma belcheri]|uniref:Uncharacterized protein LOC109485555 n=1 Tax=Branchiostoma belcheri TaxID=7741 RepID=A0A6P4ZUF2_BRABE|nr:PREDICTED: uncharacterized protein LOC109485555 [Branchiostoma belcheri]
MMASRSWFDRTNDDVTAWWFRDLIRRGVISDQADSNQRERQRRRPNRFKRWLLLERRRGLRKQSYFALVVEVGLSLAVIGLLIGLTLHVIGPVLFGIGCCLLIPSAFWFVWEFSYRTTEELEVSHRPREDDEEEENEDEGSERSATEDNVERAFQDLEPPDDFTRHSSYPSLTTLAKDFRVVSCVSALLACLLIIISLTSANDNALVEVVVFGIGLGCFLPGISFLVYLAWCESCAPASTMTEHVHFPYRPIPFLPIRRDDLSNGRSSEPIIASNNGTSSTDLRS